MFNSKGMTHLGFALEKKTKGTAMVMATTANPLRSLLFLASNLAALYHTRRHHHEQRGEAMEIGKNGKRRGNPTGFWRGMMTTDGGVPQSPFSSLLFLSLSPLCS